MPIDKNIIETVAVLNILGLPTTASCEGHGKEDDNNYFLYIWIYEPDPIFGTEEEKIEIIEARNLQYFDS